MFYRAKHLRSGLFAFVVVVNAAFAFGADQPVRYDGYSEVRALIKTDAQLAALDRLGVRVKNCTTGRGPLDVVLTPEQIDALSRLGVEMQLRVPNVQQALEMERAENAKRVTALATGDPFNDFFLDYHPYAETNGIVWYMNELVARHPTLASMVNVGTTLQGQIIWGIRVTNAATNNKPGVLYFGGEHAREWITTTVPTYFANHLLSRYGVDSEVTDLVDHVEFYLVPVFNVDGYVYSQTVDRFWRKNRRNNGNGTIGVDLDRNWGIGWGGAGSSGMGGSETFRGAAPFSEPETRVLRDFFLAHANIRAQLDLHSYSQLILWPFGYTPTLSPDQQTYSELGKEMQSLIFEVHGTPFTPGPMYTTINPASGVSIDWTYAERGILSFRLELRDTGFYGFTLPADQIIPGNEELVGAMLHLSNSDWVRAPLRLEFPNGVPERVTARQDTRITVAASAQFENVVPGSMRMHYRTSGTGPFTAAPLALIAGDIYEGVLPAMSCSASPNFYFTVQGSGGSIVSRPTGAPEQGVYSAVVVTGTATFFDEPLNVNPGWSTQGQWAWGTPTGGGGAQGGSPDPNGGFSGTGVYGYNLVGDYENSLPERHLTSGPINCGGRSGIHLSFMRWLGVEEPAWDHASVRVSNDGVNWITIWQNTSAVIDSAWIFQEFDISSIAENQPTVYLRWTMGPTDSAIPYCGWNLDDIRLTSDECELLPGDYDGDDIVGPKDYDALLICFTGSGGAAGPGCDVFDFDADGDVDCADWSDFRAQWSDPAAPPMLSACAHWPAPVVVGEGARYVALTPPPGAVPVAIHVISPDQPCLSRYVDFDPNPTLVNAGVARLVSSPVFRTPSAWGAMHLSDQRIAPGRRYRFRAEFGGDDVSTYEEAKTYEWGDAVDPLNTVNFMDVAAVVDRYRAAPQAQPIVRCDMRPAVPDYVVDFADVAITVDAFKGFAYPFEAQANCP